MNLRGRQIHLDFHTSPLIPDVGVDFDPDAFADRLARARVNSVTCFAKCHHGMFYYPSEVGPTHPSLRFDLLGQMIESCHARDIRVPAYLSVQWDEWAAVNHPEWRLIDAEGRQPGPLLGDSMGWPALCILTGYRRYLAESVVELLSRYEVDGVFFDICMDQESCSQSALRRMRVAGLDPEHGADRKTFARAEAIRFIREFAALVRKHRRGLPVFFNGRVDLPMRDSLPVLSHIELESLPTGIWGYDYFHRVGHHVRTLGKPFLGMTSRFHKSWADFGTVKAPAALEYEVLTPFVHGGGISIGDQLHPRGALNEAAYAMIERLYAKIESLEPWHERARPVAQIGVISALTNGELDRDEAVAIDRGAVAMLNETHHLYDVLDLENDFDDYDVLILPDRIAPEASLVHKLKAYVDRGGRILVSYRSLLDEPSGRFALRELGVTCEGELEHAPFYMRIGKRFAPDVPAMDHCMYESGLKIRARKGVRIAARAVTSYFNRTAAHYCSHFQTPPDRATRHPVIALTRRTAYLNAPFFAAYARHGYRVYRRLVSAAIDHLLPGKRIHTNLPTTAQVALLERKRGRRTQHILHVLNYPPIRRTPELDLIEDPQPVLEAHVDFQCEGTVIGVVRIPEEYEIEFEPAHHGARIRLPAFTGHCALCVTEAS